MLRSLLHYLDKGSHADRTGRPRGRKPARRRPPFIPRLDALEDRTLLSTVMNLNDSGPGSLRQAIMDTPSGGTVDFDPTLGGGTITLTSGTLALNKDLTITWPRPNGFSLTVSGNDAYTVFTQTAGRVTIAGLTITHGHGIGGGLEIVNAVATLNNCTITNNFTTSNGGGIFFGGPAGVLSVNNSTITGNSADPSSSRSGGGIYNSGGVVTISNSLIASNSALSGGGGGIESDGGRVTVSNSTVSGNSALVGGGIETGGTVFTVANSTIANNSARDRGAGIINGGFVPLTVTNSTIAGNSVSSSGGMGGGIEDFQHVTSITLKDTLLANNTASTGPDLDGNVHSQGHNLVSNSSGGSGYAPSDLLDVDPLLSPNGLQQNGGPTPTIALQAGSPAIDAGDNSGAPATDQRGFARIFGGTIDIGAFESRYNVVVNANDSGAGSLRQAVDSNQVDLVTFDPSLNGQTITLTSGPLMFNSSMSIAGPGANLLTVSGNNASRVFGNFQVFYMSVTISGLTIANGLANAGAGITWDAPGGTLTVDGCVLTGNTATSGGGFWDSAADGTVTIRNSTIAGNSADGLGGGLRVGGTRSLTIINSTVAGNSATEGGGIYVGGVNAGVVSLNNSTVANNTASDMGGGLYVSSPWVVRLHDTLLGYNAAVNAGPDLFGAISSQGYNLFSSSTGASGYAPTDLLDVDPLLDPNGLQDNGGPTPTIALLPGSPAIDAGDNTGAPAFDQRGPGYPRIVNGVIDIGAFEYQGGGHGARLPRGGPGQFPAVPSARRLQELASLSGPPGTPSPALLSGAREGQPVLSHTVRSDLGGAARMPVQLLDQVFVHRSGHRPADWLTDDLASAWVA